MSRLPGERTSRVKSAFRKRPVPTYQHVTTVEQNATPKAQELAARDKRAVENTASGFPGASGVRGRGFGQLLLAPPLPLPLHELPAALHGRTRRLHDLSLLPLHPLPLRLLLLFLLFHERHLEKEARRPVVVCLELLHQDNGTKKCVPSGSDGGSDRVRGGPPQAQRTVHCGGGPSPAPWPSSYGRDSHHVWSRRSRRLAAAPARSPCLYMVPV